MGLPFKEHLPPSEHTPNSPLHHAISDFNLSWIPKIRTFPCPSSPEAEGKLLLDEGTAIALREAPFASSAKLVANGEGRTG